MCKLESNKAKGRIIMTEEGQKIAKIMEMIKEKGITQRETLIRLDLSIRQIKRLYKKYKQIGDEGMNHGLIGKKSNNSYDETEKEKIMRIVRDLFIGYKPTFIAEKLNEKYGIGIKANTLRMWMMEEGLWEKVKKNVKIPLQKGKEGTFW